MPNLTCDCEDFKLGMPQIAQAQIMASPAMFSWGTKYTGKQFKFCPWCGKVLIQKKDKNYQAELDILRGK